MRPGWTAVLALIMGMSPAIAAPVSDLVDLAQSRVSPAGRVSVEDGAVVASAQMGQNPEADVTLRVQQPLRTTGRERVCIYSQI